MTSATTALSFVIDLALGVWLGAMVFFSFVAAPRIFAVLDGDRAGDVVNDIFPRYYVVGIALGSVAFVTGVLLGALSGFDLQLGLFFLFAAGGVVLAAYARWVLIPKMDAAGENAFARYHRRSVVLNGLAMLAVVLALVVSHLRWGRGYRSDSGPVVFRASRRSANHGTR